MTENERALPEKLYLQIQYKILFFLPVSLSIEHEFKILMLAEKMFETIEKERTCSFRTRAYF